MNTAGTVTLDAVRAGFRGKVAQVAGEDALAARIMEMGVTPGELVTLVGTAPLGDPLEIGIRGYRLSLRLVEARRVHLIPLVNSGNPVAEQN